MRIGGVDPAVKKTSEEFYPVALTIAGSDSGGGAGIQADLRTFNAAGVFGCSVITAITAQNPRRVLGVAPVAPEMVAQQLDAVLEALAVAAVKTGMLANAAIVRTVAGKLRGRKIPLVVDPVMISTSGTRLLEAGAMDALKEELLPLADFMTPNLPEAEWLLGRKLQHRDDYAAAALECADRWKLGCLLKTGHASGENSATDFFALDGVLYALSSPRLDQLTAFAAHGTGCTLSSAIAASLAGGAPWKTALKEAKAHVFGALCEVAHIGDGIDGMYPPLENYLDRVALRPLPGTAQSGKAGL